MHHKPPTKRQKKRVAKYLSFGEDVILVNSISTRYFLITLFTYLFIPLLLIYGSLFMFFGVFDIPGYSWIKYFGIFPLIFFVWKFPKLGTVLRKKQSHIYVITNRRILIISGLFSRKIVTAPLDRITHLTVDQSFIQRFLYNTGHLLIITAGFDQREIVVEHIASPVKFKILIEELTAGLEKKTPEPTEFKLRALTLN